MSLLDSLKAWTAVHEEKAGKPMPLQPASDELLTSIEEGSGMTLPDQVVTLLRYTNGVPLGWLGRMEYDYFPGARFYDVSQHYGGARMLNQGLSHGDDVFFDNNLEKSITLFEADLIIGVVCEGPETGRLWHMHDLPLWVAESIEHLVEISMRLNAEGYLRWNLQSHKDVYSPSGCAVMQNPNGAGWSLQGLPPI